MHGRKTSAREELDPAEVRLARMQKYKQYLQACDLALQSEQSAQILGEKVLRYNPDFTTLWNARRRGILAEFGTWDDSQRAERLARELELTKMQISERNSKSYGAWFHRRWAVAVLVSVEEGKVLADLDAEFALCDLLLQRDERNFHCWHYRNFLLSKDPVRFPAEVGEKSSQLIARNFSNYSAWHLRAQALRRQQDGAGVDWAEELERTHQAMFTEPADQSAWLFYRWMLKKHPLAESEVGEEIELILSLLEDEGKDCKWPLLALVQLEASLPEDSKLLGQGESYCQRLKAVDHLHANFYHHVAGLFAKRDFKQLKQLLFG
ncbi:hypothetical protein BASA81_000786 [Batrachochytrium salamandrivorans]|nr:hypothetical protein BASA81_000786 [Batrachochytrium salamandrivorans]